MTDLASHVQDYLRMRRSLGFRLELEAYVLPQLVGHLDAVGASTLTVAHAVSWARRGRDVTPKTLENRLTNDHRAEYDPTARAAHDNDERGLLAGRG